MLAWNTNFWCKAQKTVVATEYEAWYEDALVAEHEERCGMGEGERKKEKSTCDFRNQSCLGVGVRLAASCLDRPLLEQYENNKNSFINQEHDNEKLCIKLEQGESRTLKNARDAWNASSLLPMQFLLLQNKNKNKNRKLSSCKDGNQLEQQELSTHPRSFNASRGKCTKIS